MYDLSIIVPVYDTTNYLSRCINSLLKQTLKSIKILIVNFSLKESFKKEIHKYLKNNSNIAIINLTDTKNFYNVIFLKSFSNYIGFCNSNDYVDPEYYANLYNYFDKYDIIKGQGYKNTEDSNNYISVIVKKQFLIDNNIKDDSIYINKAKIFEVKDNNIYYHQNERF